MAGVPDVNTLLLQLSEAFHKKTDSKDASTQVEIWIAGWERPVKRKWEDVSDAMTEIQSLQSESDMESIESRQVARIVHECSKCHCRATGDKIIDVFGVKVKGQYGNKKWQAWCIKCRSGYNKRGDAPKGLPTPPCSPPGLPPGVIDDDDKSVIIGRRGGIYTGTNQYTYDDVSQKTKPAGFKFFYTVRKPSETWSNAEERLVREDAPIVKKRSKCIRMLATQDGISVDQAIVRYNANTTTELFYLVKKTSPELISSRKLLAEDTL